MIEIILVLAKIGCAAMVIVIAVSLVQVYREDKKHAEFIKSIERDRKAKNEKKEM